MIKRRKYFFINFINVAKIEEISPLTTQPEYCFAFVSISFHSNRICLFLLAELQVLICKK